MDETEKNCANGLSDKNALERINEQTEENQEKRSPSRTGTKVKRKVKSTRRKLNAMLSNASLHFSDSDSEGELTAINSQAKSLSNVAERPIISITTDDAEFEDSNILSPDDKSPFQRSFIENLTDVDEIYPSDLENDQKENQVASLKVDEANFQGDTDLEDFEGDDEVQSTIYVEPRCDIFCDYSGETVTTKEGDGPFSVEVRNKMYVDEIASQKVSDRTPDILVVSNTDEEYLEASDEEFEVACCSQKEFPEDLDVLAASQVVMKNINKMENLLNIARDVSDDAISDCHTDVEDVDPNE